MMRLLSLLLGQAEEQELQRADAAHQVFYRHSPAGFRAEFPVHGR